MFNVVINVVMKYMISNVRVWYGIVEFNVPHDTV